MDLSEFLLARIAEDEAAAREATPAPWRAAAPDEEVPWEACGSGWYVYAESRDYWGPVTAGPWGGDLGKDAFHIARHDPARVLAECGAKRRLVERSQMVIDSFERTARGLPGYVAWTDVNRREKSHAWDNLYALAAAYADHPDCRPEWAPEVAAV